MEALGAFTDMAQWRFILPLLGNKAYYAQLGLVENLDSKLGTSKVYIIDKK
jgi:hypothetical protein